MAPPNTPALYTFWFTIFDPLVLTTTQLTCLFSPSAMLDAFIPPSIWALEQHQVFLIHQLAILYGFMALIFGVLLRASADPAVWTIVQAATLCVDVALLAATYDALRVQGRLDTATWRGGDWFNAVFTVCVALVRAAYLAGVGFGAKPRADKKKS